MKVMLEKMFSKLGDFTCVFEPPNIDMRAISVVKSFSKKNILLKL